MGILDAACRRIIGPDKLVYPDLAIYAVLFYMLFELPTWDYERRGVRSIK
ncbi:MAG: hypothetical protein ABIJ26_07735 [Candidatus Margulisiibacteriota bacterium]